VQLALKNELHSKNLEEKDLDFLVRVGFEGWMQYMMNTHFKMELNLTASVAVP